MTRRRVVITGMGLVSAAGGSLESSWARLLAGQSAIAPIRRFEASRYPSRIAAEIDPATLPPVEAAEYMRDEGLIARYAAAAAERALADAGWRGDPRRVGVAMAAGMGRYGHHEIFSACAAAAAAG